MGMHFLPAGAEIPALHRLTCAVHFTPGPDKAVRAAIAAFCLAAAVIFWPGSRQAPGRYQKKSSRSVRPEKSPGLFVHPAQGPGMLTPDFEIAFLLKHVYHKQYIVSRREAFY